MIGNLRVRKVAILGLKRIGDAIYTLPLFEAIKARYPDAEIDVFTEPQVKDIYTANPFIAEVHAYSKKAFWSSTLATLKSENYDVCIVLHNAFKYALLPFLARIPVRIGYRKELRGALLTHKIALPTGVTHRLEHNARLADFLDVQSRQILPRLYFSSAEEQGLQALLERHALMSQGYVAFIVGSIAATRRWFPENFARVADLINAELGLKVVVLGGPEDVAIAEKVVNLCASETQILNLAGQTSLRETLLLFKEARAVVTNDTGPMHAASAIGVPVVTWFGAANEDEIAPPSPQTTILNAHVHCSPCVKETCPYQLECLTAITPTWVMKTLKEKI